MSSARHSTGQCRQSTRGDNGSCAFDLLKQLTFYGSYHHNRWNKLLHFVFVPVIVWSVAVWSARSGPYISNQLHQPYDQLFSINAAFIWLVSLAGYYITLDGLAGVTWGLCVGLPTWILGNAMFSFVKSGWLWAMGAFIFSWYVQIHPGHMILEGRMPAMMDSCFQSLVLAPLFVWFELLFLLGYRPDLYEQLNKQIKRQLTQLGRNVDLKFSSVSKPDPIEDDEKGNVLNRDPITNEVLEN